MLVSYPLVIAHNLVFGSFWELACFNLSVVALFGLMYWLDTRKLPEAQRVHPLWFLPMAALMPVTYLLYTPLAFFTLDSSSWETRSKPAPAAGTS
jgi:hypothetical protein